MRCGCPGATISRKNSAGADGRVLAIGVAMQTRSLLLACILASLPISVVGCSAENEVTTEDAFTRASKTLTIELEGLGGSKDDVTKLHARMVAEVDKLKAQKKEAKTKAAADISSYTKAHWDRAWFTPAEKDLAIDVRSKDIFDRPERRRLDGAEAKVAVLESLLALPGLDDAKAFALKEQYVEVAIALEMNGELGLVKQGFSRLLNTLRTKVSWLGKVFKGLRRETAGAEANNIDLSGNVADLWKRDPLASTVWHRRSEEEVTPARIAEGPWYRGQDLPRIPKAGEVWTLRGLRSQQSDGSHPSVDIGFEDAEVKLKLRRAEPNVFEDPVYARLLWAMGYETEPNYLARNVRVEPRVYLAAHASKARVGWRFRLGSRVDDIVSGRPPKGISVPLSGVNVAPQAEFIHVHYNDGRDENGDQALSSLTKALDDRPLMNTMAYVDLERAHFEAKAGDRDAIGSWDFDAEAHINQREVRALGITMLTWMDSRDMKPNNLRLELTRKRGVLTLSHVVSDVGCECELEAMAANFTINPTGRFLHGNNNNYTVDAFDRMTIQDARWGTAQVAALTVAQIRAAVASGAYTKKAEDLVVARLVSRRNSLVETFGLTAQFSQLVE